MDSHWVSKVSIKTPIPKTVGGSTNYKIHGLVASGIKSQSSLWICTAAICVFRGLVLKNVVITTIRALTAGELNVTLGNIKTALLDGSEAEYREFVGSESVRLVIADHVPADRLFRVWDDDHRDQCFATIRMNGLHGGGDDHNCNDRRI